MRELIETEKLLFAKYADFNVNDLPLVFILGSPRTGSTLIYQLLINHFNFSYFSNFINDYFPNYPLVGMALSCNLVPVKEIPYKSCYGKTEGIFEPSEASNVFRNWFGGEHPSQTHSSSVLSKQKSHMLLTMKGIFSLTTLPILTKNAWNCFRIKNLKRLFPKIYFIWIRRDIGMSAFSDLKSRYAQGSPTIWNSATTSNYKEIQKRPYWEQVVEQQFEFNQCIANNLQKYSADRYVECWYEDLCSSLEMELNKISNSILSPLLSNRNGRRVCSSQGNLEPVFDSALEKDDFTKIENYISQNFAEIKPYRNKKYLR